MIMQKYEIAGLIDRIKGIVPKNCVFPALEGILVRDGILVGTNMELTIQARSDACLGESFIIPARAFDMIKNLPEGEVEIRAEADYRIRIKAGRATSRCQSHNPDDFSYYRPDDETGFEAVLPGSRLEEAFQHVIYAASDKDERPMCTGVYLDSEEGALNIVALDGHVMAWDRIEAECGAGMKVLIPKNAVKKLLSLWNGGDISVSYNRFSAAFTMDSFTVYTRLLDSKYMDYRRYFSDTPGVVTVYKKQLLESLNRAKLCIDNAQNDRRPAVLHFSGDTLDISLMGNFSDYHETIDLASVVNGELRIGLNPNLLAETAKAFAGDTVKMQFSGPKDPVYVTGEGETLKTLILPVTIGAAG